MGCVYVWTNTVNGKQYVGKTLEPEARRRSHLSEANRGEGFYFHQAIRKHGIDAFTYDEVFWSDDDTELKSREVEEIAQRGTFGGGYNMTPGGEGVVLTPDALARRSASIKAANARPGVLERRSASSKAANARPDVRAKKSASSKATLARPEVKAKLSASAKAVAARPGESERRSARFKAFAARPGERQRMSDRAKAVAARPGESERRSARSKASNARRTPNVFVEGEFFPSMTNADHRLGICLDLTRRRCKSTSPRWQWWHTIPNHNDPECDAVEECWAIMQWAAANQDHPKVPDWAKRASAAT